MRQLFETVLRRCVAEGMVGGEGFAVDASLIKADANRQRGVEGTKGLAPEMTSRAIDEYLTVLDDAAFGAATEVTPKFISPADPAARWTAAHGGLAFFAYSTNYLIDLDNAIIVDVEASTAIRQAEVTAAKTMIERVDKLFSLYPERLAADTAYGSGEMLDWLVHERGIEPHIPVFDKSKHTDDTFSRSDFTYDHEGDAYLCPGGKILKQRQKIYQSAANDWSLALARKEPRSADAAQQTASDALKTLSARLRSAIPTRQAIHRLRVAPDGMLNLVPFAALSDGGGHYLVEQFEIAYLGAARDLAIPTGRRRTRPDHHCGESRRRRGAARERAPAISLFRGIVWNDCKTRSRKRVMFNDGYRAPSFWVSAKPPNSVSSKCISGTAPYRRARHRGGKRRLPVCPL